MFGFAIDETKELMPMPIQYSHALMKKLADLRHGKKLKFLRPDAKSQVTVIYENGKPIKLAKLVKKNGKLEQADGLYIASTDSGDRVNACIIAGDETNNYLKYGGTMWRVCGYLCFHR